MIEPLADAAPDMFRDVRIVLADMDDTLVHNGRLAASTLDALERLQSAGIKTIPVTAAPAGWCDQMARTWPVEGVIGENGGFFFRFSQATGVLTRMFWHDEHERPSIRNLLVEIGREVQRRVPSVEYAEDSPFRLTSIAFTRPQGRKHVQDIMGAIQMSGANASANNLWILAWLGSYDMLGMSERVLRQCFDINISKHPREVLYIGDSIHAAAMFGSFQHSVGGSTVRRYLPEIGKWPRWIASEPGGSGFVEVADVMLRGLSQKRGREAVSRALHKSVRSSSRKGSGRLAKLVE